MGLFSEKKKVYIRGLSLYYKDDEPWVEIEWKEKGESLFDYSRNQRTSVKLEDFSKENVLKTIAIALAQRREKDEKEFQEKTEEFQPREYYEIDMDEAKELLEKRKED